MLFNLKSGRKQDLNLDEDEEFEVEWVGKEDILNEIKDELHLKTFDYCLNEGAMIGEGIHINSDFLNGLELEDAKNKIDEELNNIDHDHKTILDIMKDLIKN